MAGAASRPAWTKRSADIAVPARRTLRVSALLRFILIYPSANHRTDFRPSNRARDRPKHKAPWREAMLIVVLHYAPQRASLLCSRASEGFRPAHVTILPH